MDSGIFGLKPNYMNNDSLLISLSKQVNTIQQTLDKEAGFLSQKFLIVYATILTGIIIFYLNRGKEYRTKRAEIAGEIYLLLHDFKAVFVEVTTAYFKVDGGAKVIELMYAESARASEEESKRIRREIHFFKLVQEKDMTRLMETNDKLEPIRRDLTKYFGQYKFYLSKLDREEFEKTLEIFRSMPYQKYSFEGFEDTNKVDQRIVQLMLSFRNDLKKKFAKEVDIIEKFLVDNID